MCGAGGMNSDFDILLHEAYAQWKKEFSGSGRKHLSQEEIVCFVEGRLIFQHAERVKAHFLRCERCADAGIGLLRDRLKTGETGGRNNSL